MVEFFLPSPSGVYGWVSYTILLRWTVGEANCLCRQAGRVNKQSTYVDVYFRQHDQKGFLPFELEPCQRLDARTRYFYCVL